jgi:hypothetical protein
LAEHFELVLASQLRAAVNAFLEVAAAEQEVVVPLSHLQLLRSLSDEGGLFDEAAERVEGQHDRLA